MARSLAGVSVGSVPWIFSVLQDHSKSWWCYVIINYPFSNSLNYMSENKYVYYRSIVVYVRVFTEYLITLGQLLRTKRLRAYNL